MVRCDDNLTELPFGLPGRVYRSPMPFGLYDQDGDAYREFVEKGVSVVVMLVTDEECREKAGRDLKDLYLSDGFEVISMPVPDFGTPSSIDGFEAVVLRVAGYASEGHNIVVHCSAGIGRTGMFAACLARTVLGFDGYEAIDWVNGHVRGAVETEGQRDFVCQFDAFRP